MTTYTPVQTKDGTMTFHNSTFDQTYHSQSGAWEEAVEKYVKPCAIKDGMRILDYCFGLGYNTLAALASASRLSIVALENDADMLLRLSELSFADVRIQQIYQIMVEQLRQQLLLGKTDFLVIVGDSSVRFLIGDARTAILSVKDSTMDAIFFDPFSPKVCPDLWTLSVFTQCRRVVKPSGVLATYSYARSVRENLSAAGFVVSDGPTIGRRSPSTLARPV